MVEPAHHFQSIPMQCRLLRISRSSYYYAPAPERDETLALMTMIDETFQAFTAVLRDAEIWISMDGRGRWMDNLFIERL